MSEALSQPLNNQPVEIPDAYALCANSTQVTLLTPDGEMETLSHHEASEQLSGQAVILCHAPYTTKMFDLPLSGAIFDVLELFAFVHPAKFCVPTINGLCKTLGLPVPNDMDDQAFALLSITQALLKDLRADQWQAKAPPLAIANVMGKQGQGWAWTPFIFKTLGEEYDPRLPLTAKSDLNIWKNLAEYAEKSPPPPGDHFPITKDETTQKLHQILGEKAEKRPAQESFAQSLTPAFAPKQELDQPHIVVAQAGTGVGKTLGYLAPSAVWSDKNEDSVWISTYTKNLQRQVNQELDRLYPDEALKDHKVAIRKGRENYLCLLNFEESASAASMAYDPRHAIAMGIMARWIAATKDGDLMSGSDFPGWITGLLGYQYTGGLSDKRGECIHSSCDHYNRCFVEQSVRQSRHARMVVANHALVMINAAISQNIDDTPKRIIFDEAHHLFDAADSAFCGHLTARETFELRRWIRGNQNASASRMRGLKSRAEDLLQGDTEGIELLQDILQHSSFLTDQGWQRRLKDKNPKGVCEEFILRVYEQIECRGEGLHQPFSVEIPTYPLNDGVDQAIEPLLNALRALKSPMTKLATHLRKRMNDQADTLKSDVKKRMDTLQGSLDQRAQLILSAWILMLENLKEQQQNDDFSDWMQLERSNGKAVDIGLYRHWINPMVPFANTMKESLHGAVMTSATLKDPSHTEPWQSAITVTGAKRLNDNPDFVSYESPFDYAQNTRVIIITDIRKDAIDQIASAYEKLFLTAGGGAIGLFTAISRLKSVYSNIKQSLEHNAIPLYAQHMDEIDTGTLIDIFRDEENACLLGTDAIRDGVDVPGNSLRMMVFDRIPWPRPTILHKARRNYFGGRSQYDDRLTRLKLKQAFGRLIRRQGDKGVFVMLDNGMPSRLYDSFPSTVTIERLALSEAIPIIKEFLDDNA